LFLGIIVLVAIRFGVLAGIFGTITAALIFAVFLFEPRLSLAVQDSVAKSNLIWMLVAGIAISELVGHQSRSGTGKRRA
jgi:K+-sensing histidine kinase KdpD